MEAALIPVEMLSFTGKNAGDINVMEWTTASEINNDYFSMLRSTNGKNFDVIGTIKGAGSSNEISDYSFTDRGPLPGINYYRLMQTDYNGEISYSNIIAIKITVKLNPVIISPNPAADFIQITLHNTAPGFEIEIVNALDETILKTRNQNKINISELSKGIYFLKLKTGNELRFQKFIRQ